MYHEQTLLMQIEKEIGAYMLSLPRSSFLMPVSSIRMILSLLLTWIVLYTLWIQRQSIYVYRFFLGQNFEKTKGRSNFIPYWIFRGQYRYLLRLQADWYTMSISLMCLFLSLDLFTLWIGGILTLKGFIESRRTWDIS